MKYAFITRKKKTFAIDRMCRVLGVSRNGYYRYVRTELVRAANDDNAVWIDRVKAACETNRYRYRSRRLSASFTQQGYGIGRYKVRRLMREAGVRIRYRRRYKATTNSDHNHPVYENVLDRGFSECRAQ